MVPIDFYSVVKILWKSMGTKTGYILQNTFFCAQQKTETYTGLGTMLGRVNDDGTDIREIKI